ncbi:FKBP-type peptidyl-prolyl cis-trans isomerase [Microbacterium betulae]|uniref:Peptidyl-prolyl cis-trans isomerase n=1 Tax=Microbacterium betulae TaxID=2981139 RepID=A0AA97FEG2_9MICO|nr:FKBP-type peptidyl-prolyl cis-trans isomerase [Microbacterium sp. AB]WOF22091.1 FKBP-type peptidyl-prolyl cis-trans isomerase [Microbacterium sp. AB]
MSTVAVAALALAGCTSSGDAETDTEATAAPADLCDAVSPSGDAVESVTVDGEVGEPSTATFDAPLEVPELQSLQISEGEGDPIESGDYINYAMTAYDAASGEELGQLGYDEGELLPSSVAPESLGPYIGCASIGSRFVLGFPATTDSTTGAELTAQVYVFDVLSENPTAAWGEPQEPVEGLPTVELAEDGAPTVTIPDGATAPETTELETLKLGDGTTVESGDNVLVQYTGVKLSDGTVFDSSWDAGTPAQFSTAGVVEGFQKALEGQTVGSQVLAVIPPAEGYGVEGQEENELYDETLVFVVDILGTQHAVAAE